MARLGRGQPNPPIISRAPPEPPETATLVVTAPAAEATFTGGFVLALTPQMILVRHGAVARARGLRVPLPVIIRRSPVEVVESATIDGTAPSAQASFTGAHVDPLLLHRITIASRSHDPRRYRWNQTTPRRSPADAAPAETGTLDATAPAAEALFAGTFVDPLTGQTVIVRSGAVARARRAYSGGRIGVFRTVFEVPLLVTGTLHPTAPAALAGFEGGPVGAFWPRTIVVRSGAVRRAIERRLDSHEYIDQGPPRLVGGAEAIINAGAPGAVASFSTNVVFGQADGTIHAVAPNAVASFVAEVTNLGVLGGVAPAAEAAFALDTPGAAAVPASLHATAPAAQVEFDLVSNFDPFTPQTGDGDDPFGPSAGPMFDPFIPED